MNARSSSRGDGRSGGSSNSSGNAGKLIKTNTDTLILIEHILKNAKFVKLDIKDYKGGFNGPDYYMRLDEKHIFIHGGDIEDIKRQVRAHFEKNIYLDTAPRL